MPRAKRHAQSGGRSRRKSGSGVRRRRGGSLLGLAGIPALIGAAAYLKHRARKKGKGFGSKLKSFAKYALPAAAALAGTAFLGHRHGNARYKTGFREGFAKAASNAVR